MFPWFLPPEKQESIHLVQFKGGSLVAHQCYLLGLVIIRAITAFVYSWCLHMFGEFTTKGSWSSICISLGAIYIYGVHLPSPPEGQLQWPQSGHTCLLLDLEWGLEWLTQVAQLRSTAVGPKFPFSEAIENERLLMVVKPLAICLYDLRQENDTHRNCSQCIILHTLRP